MSPLRPASAKKKKKDKKTGIARRTRDSINVSDMDITLGNTSIEQELDESVDTSASKILVGIANQQQQRDSMMIDDSFDEQFNTNYKSKVDNFVVNYDSDVSITIPLRSTKVPGFSKLFDEEDASANPITSSADTSNGSELDMSMTRNYKFEPTNNADITNHFVTDMSIMNFTRNNIEADTSADMSMTRVDIGKFYSTETSKMKFSPDDSVDMSVTNIRIPDPNTTRHFAADDMSLTHAGGFDGDDTSEGDMSMTCTNIDVSQLSNTSTTSDNKFGGYRDSTVNNFVVNYDEDVSVTMSLTKARQLALAAEEEEAEAKANNSISICESPKYKEGVDNFVMNYDDDEADASLLQSEADNKDMTLTKMNFDKQVDDDVSMTMTRTDLGKLNVSAREELNDSITGKKRKSDLNTSVSSLRASPKIFTKILTPSKQPRTPLTPQVQFPERTTLTPQFTLPSNIQDGQTPRIMPATPTDEKISTVEEFLNGSKYAPESSDDSRFSFTRFLQLANLRFYQQRVSTLGAFQRNEVDEEPSDIEVLESAFITRHDFNDLQTAGEQLRVFSAEKKLAAERTEKLLAASQSPPKLYAQLQSSDPAEVEQAIKRANKLMSISKTQAKVEFLEFKQHLEHRSLDCKRVGLERLRQDAARLANMVKSLKALTEELPTDVKILEQTKQHNQQQRIQLTQPQPTPAPTQTSSILPKYFLSTGSQTESRKSSKRACTENTAELQRVMNEDFDFVQFMQKSLHWVPRVFNESELLFHWDFYKIHIFLDPNSSAITRSVFSLINPHQRLNDFHVGVMRSAQIQHLLQGLKTKEDLVPVLQQVFHRLHRVRLIFNTVKRLSSTYHVKTDTGVIEIQFSDHRATTKFGVVFELTCAYPFSELVAIPRKPLFGSVTVAGIAAVLESVEPGYERMERACAALMDLAVDGKDPVEAN